ncbi:MAG: T9SS type A sorting domain-containing protein [Ignavibacteria bacterium]
MYDILGREVSTLVNEQLKAGTYQIDWDGSNFASGVYFYELTTETFSETKKLILIK